MVSVLTSVLTMIGILTIRFHLRLQWLHRTTEPSMGPSATDRIRSTFKGEATSGLWRERGCWERRKEEQRTENTSGMNSGGMWSKSLGVNQISHLNIQFQIKQSHTVRRGHQRPGRMARSGHPMPRAAWRAGPDAPAGSQLRRRLTPRPPVLPRSYHCALLRRILFPLFVLSGIGVWQVNEMRTKI